MTYNLAPRDAGKRGAAMRRPSRCVWAVTVLGMALLLPAGAFAQQESVAPPPGGIVHTVVAGDTLWDLAAKYLGSPWKWTEIWEQNRFVTNPHYIYPGIQIVIEPPPPREMTMLVEPPPAAPASESAPAAPAAGQPPETAPVSSTAAPQPPAAGETAAAPAPPPDRYLNIEPADFVAAGEFVRRPPEGIGHIVGGRDPKVEFSEGDIVYLGLNKTIPAGQMLGVYRVRGPITVRGDRSYSGYVKYLVGVVQVGPTEDGEMTAKVRASFEDLTRADLVSEEIPAYSRVKITPGNDSVSSRVIAGRRLNEELATGDFVYLDRGASAGVEIGNVFRVLAPTGNAVGTPSHAVGAVKTDVARMVIVRVSDDFATAYVASSSQAFETGVPVRRGLASK
jgi:LysM repeat protein